jgi:hypothetical protein
VGLDSLHVLMSKPLPRLTGVRQGGKHTSYYAHVGWSSSQPREPEGLPGYRPVEGVWFISTRERTFDSAGTLEPCLSDGQKDVLALRGRIGSGREAAGKQAEPNKCTPHLGYDAVIIGQSHGGTRNGLLPDGFFCGGQGHDYDEQIPAICLGHRAMHLMFNDEPAYTGDDGTDIPLSTLGERYVASTEFDGWGYVQLHDARDPNLRIIDSYAVPEALDEDFAEGFGVLSVHEVKTDPRDNVNFAYISYYNAGARVVQFSRRKGIVEKGFFIDEGGNHFWGTFPHRLGKSQGQPLLLFSDRDHGLYILRYTGN